MPDHVFTRKFSRTAGSRSILYSTHPLPPRRIDNIQRRIVRRSGDTGAFRKNRFEEINR